MVVILQPFLIQFTRFLSKYHKEIQFTRFLSKYHKEYIKNNLFLNVMKTQTQGAPIRTPLYCMMNFRVMLP